MDSQAVMTESCCSALTATIRIYRSLATSTAFTCSRTFFLIVCLLGWLYQIPNFPSSFFSEFDPVRTPLLELENKTSSLDSQVSIPVEVLYLCCPFLHDIHLSLAKFSAGLQTKLNSRRKIKPLTTAIENMNCDPFEEIELQLLENFYHACPSHVKQMCEITAERLSHSVDIHVQTQLVPNYIEMTSLQCVLWLRDRVEYFIVKELETKLEGDRYIKTLVSDASKRLSFDIKEHITRICQTQSKAAINILLGDSVSSKVISTAATVASRMTMSKCFNNTRFKALVKLEEEVVKAFEKGHRGLVWHLRTLTLPISIFSVQSNIEHLHWNCSFSKLKDTYKKCFDSHLPLSSESYCTLLRALSSFIEIMQCRAYIIPGVPSPPHVVVGPLTEYQKLSIKLVALMVRSASCKLRELQEHSGCDLLEKFIEGWKLCKEFKVEISVYELMSVTSFDSYIKSEAEHNMNDKVWQQLAYVLSALVCNGLVSSAIIEGLWLCRWHQVKRDVNRVQAFFKSAKMFLHLWQSFSNTKDFFIPAHFVRLMSVVDFPMSFMHKSITSRVFSIPEQESLRGTS